MGNRYYLGVVIIRLTCLLLGIGTPDAFRTAAYAAPISLSMVTVGDPGNASGTSGYGSVGYSYQIGTYPVTIGQYASFLNAVAKSDTYALYNTNMGTNLNVAGINRTGTSGAYSYSVMTNAGSSGNRPISYVSWFDAARFANWMANGQPTGSQSGTTTENGAYALNGVVSGTAPARNATNPNTGRAPTFTLPTENEWFKAAYYDPSLNAGAGGYWEYATRSDTAPGNIVGAEANQANWYVGAGYCVTQTSTNSATDNYLTDVGAFTGSASSYGTYDQSGNVFQWNDLDELAGTSRGYRGGFFGSRNVPSLSSSNRIEGVPSNESSQLGFRLVAPVPEPSSTALYLVGLSATLLVWGNRARGLHRAA